jgi:hypothetical protein
MAINSNNPTTKILELFKYIPKGIAMKMVVHNDKIEL